MVQEARVHSRFSYLLAGLAALASGIAYGLYGLAFIEILFIVAGLVFFGVGFIILPRNASRKQWKRTLGFWFGAGGCELASATVFFYERTPQGMTTTACAGFAIIAALLSLLLLWESL